MKLIVDPTFAAKFPKLSVAFVVARGVQNTHRPEALEQLTRESEARFRSKVASNEALEALPEIQLWRAAYTALGVNPKRMRPSAEALLRRVVKGDAVPWISPAVNAYLATELDHLLPVGGYDLGRVQGDVTLRLSPGGEAFIPIGPKPEEKTDANEAVYADAGGVLTRGWNFRDCDRTKVDLPTTDLALFVELPDATLPPSRAVEAIAAIAQNLERFCSAKTQTGLLEVEKAREVVLP